MTGVDTLPTVVHCDFVRTKYSIPTLWGVDEMAHTCRGQQYEKRPDLLPAPREHSNSSSLSFPFFIFQQFSHVPTEQELLCVAMPPLMLTTRARLAESSIVSPSPRRRARERSSRNGVNSKGGDQGLKLQATSASHELPCANLRASTRVLL